MENEYLYLWAQWNVLTHDRYKRLMERYDSLEEAWHKVDYKFFEGTRMRKDTLANAFELRRHLSFESIMEVCKRLNIRVYSLHDEAYPENLKQLEKAPPFLWVRGELPLMHKSISIVGTRACTDYGKRITQKLTADLVREDFVVVSGLALGVDAIAHRSTLDEGGKTVAVLGSSVDMIYPRSNYRLATDMLSKGGAVVSTYPLGTKARKVHFPQRNEIIAGLTRGTLVIEGGLNSGALITARKAHEYGREVFAIPNNLTSLALSGTNHLIRNSEAKLVENIDHILEDFGMNGTLMKEEQEFTHDERVVLEKLAGEGKNVDELLEVTPYNIPELSEILIMLELRSIITMQGRRYVLI